MKNKAFTLIELLAVIVILAIIALIATPIIINTIQESKEKTFLLNANLYLKSVEWAINKEELNEYVFDSNECIVVENGNLKCDGDTEYLITVDVTGQYPEQGSVIKFTNKKIDGMLLSYSNGKSVVKDKNNKLVSITTPISFEKDSWDTITTAINVGYLDKYKVGDTKSIMLDGFGTFEVRISNMSTPEECELEDFSQTACGFVIEFVDIITTYQMNGNYTNIGGWEKTKMRTYLTTTIYESLPEELKNIIIDTKVVYNGGYNEGGDCFFTTDKIYLLSTKEIYGKNLDYDTIKKTRQMDYYEQEKVTTSEYLYAIKNYNAEPVSWWLRAACTGTGNAFAGVENTGKGNYLIYAVNQYGVAPAFRIG